jgi:protein-tyrosine phosphatase
MRRLLEQIDERWGSAAGYLRAQGMTESELAALSAALVEPFSSQETARLASS